MVTRDGKTITVSSYVEWDDVRTTMDTVLESYELPALVREFTDDEIESIMGSIEDAICMKEEYEDKVEVDKIIESFCEEWLNDNDYIKEQED